LVSTSIRIDSGKLSELIGVGYDAALSRPAWLLFADRFAAASGSDMVMIQYQDSTHPERSFLISRNTAKTHLARVFDKTGVRSQAALLRLLSTGSGA
jgi:hypothetical protein